MTMGIFKSGGRSREQRYEKFLRLDQDSVIDCRARDGDPETIFISGGAND